MTHGICMSKAQSRSIKEERGHMNKIMMILQLDLSCMPCYVLYQMSRMLWAQQVGTSLMPMIVNELLSRTFLST